MSTDSLPAVTEPPTRIVDEQVHLDPEKVIKAWLTSAEVLRDVAAAVRENQEDNDAVRRTMDRLTRLGLFATFAALVVHLTTLGVILWSTFDTHKHIERACPSIVAETP